jgi:hypothetical protein
MLRLKESKTAEQHNHVGVIAVSPLSRQANYLAEMPKYG